MEQVQEPVMAMTANMPLHELQHTCLDDLNWKGNNILKNGLVSDVNFINVSRRPYTLCIKGKQSKKSFRKQRGRRAKEKLGLIHSDVYVEQWVNHHLEKPNTCWPSLMITLEGQAVYFFKTKDKVTSKFQKNQSICWKWNWQRD